MRAVNLLVREQTQRRLPSKVALAGAASSGAVLMALGALYVNAHGTVRDRQGSLDELKAELAALPPVRPEAAPNANAKLVAERSGRLTVLSSALSQRVRWDRLFRELAIVLPGDIWLESLEASSPTPASSVPVAGAAAAPPTTTPTAPVSTFTIVGNAYNHEGVARLMIRLQLVPDLENIQLTGTQRATDAKSASLHFTITANVKPPEAAQ
jgi:Tfp pilus assembly protein PilN